MDFRYERKYRIPNIDYLQVIEMIKRHPAAFIKQYPDRLVNNVYFDAPELKTYHENVMGVPDRSKYRLRWYGDNFSKIINPKFEIKSKHGELGFKVVSDWIGEFDLNWSSLNNEVEERLNVGLTLLPTLMNAYNRSYFISSDKLFRLTIDRAIRYFPVTKSHSITRLPIEEPIVIVEIKYDQNNEGKADQIFRNIPFRQSKNSKYVNGVLLTCS